ncbi:MAG: hypothetical protein AAGU74_06850 [Bacillota bacterium]
MKKLLFVLLYGCICCFLLGCKSDNGAKVFRDLNARDVSSFTVTLLPPAAEFTTDDETSISELVDILREITLLESDDSYRDYNGQWVEFQLKMNDGGVRTIAAYNPFIIIDGVGYQTEYAPCEKLNAFGNALYDSLS